MRQHLHVVVQSLPRGRHPQTRSARHRAASGHYRPRIRRGTGRSGQQVEQTIQSRRQILDPTRAELRKRAGRRVERSGLFVPIHRRRRHLRGNPERSDGKRLPAAVYRRRILPRFAVRTAVVRDRRDACELPHHARVVQTRDGDQTRRQHGGTRRRGPDGVGRHQLRHPPHRPQTEADRGDRYRPDASGSRRIALFARGSR